MNIVLTGMPGCGKSTVGPLLERPFYDTDAEVEKAAGRSIAEIFAEEGEARFRKWESEAVSRLSALDGAVIATGGGVVLNPENMRALKRSGFVVFLDRPYALISTSNAVRPLLKSAEEWKRLYEARLPLYQKYADITVANEKSPGDCAGEILKRIEWLERRNP
jgi:shikimate kinase